MHTCMPIHAQMLIWHINDNIDRPFPIFNMQLEGCTWQTLIMACVYVYTYSMCACLSSQLWSVTIWFEEGGKVYWAEKDLWWN